MDLHSLSKMTSSISATRIAAYCLTSKYEDRGYKAEMMHATNAARLIQKPGGTEIDMIVAFRPQSPQIKWTQKPASSFQHFLIKQNSNLPTSIPNIKCRLASVSFIPFAPLQMKWSESAQFVDIQQLVIQGCRNFGLDQLTSYSWCVNPMNIHWLDPPKIT